MKIIISNGIFALTVFALNGCITTLPMGMPGMMPGEMMASYPIAGAQQGVYAPVSGGANWARSGMMGSGGTDAETFASNVLKLEIGKSTKEDVTALLGSPQQKSKMGEIDGWIYNLNTGQNIPSSSQIQFKNEKLFYIMVMKMGFSGGTMDSEIIYQKGP